MSWLLALVLGFAPPAAGETGADGAAVETGTPAGEGADEADLAEDQGARTGTDTDEAGPGPDEDADADELGTGATDAQADDAAGTDTGALAPPDPAAQLGPAPAPVKRAPKVPANDPDAPLTVTTRLTPDPSHIGDLLTLEVIVAFPRDHSVHLPNGLDLAPLELIESTRGEIEPTGEGLRQRFTLKLQSFEVGEAWVPSFPITWVDPNEEVHTFHVAPHEFEVESLLVNESDPVRQGEDPPISIEYPNERAAIAIVAALAGLLLALTILLIVLRLSRRVRAAFVPPPVPPHVTALRALAELEGQREAMIEAGAYQDYYLRLTEIAKRYLGGRFDFEALDRTTEEIADLFAREAVDLGPLDRGEVLAFLQACDLVKFARLSPPEEETREALDFVRELVERSRPRPEQGQEQGEATAPSTSRTEPRDPDQPRASRPKPAEAPGAAEAPKSAATSDDAASEEGRP